MALKKHTSQILFAISFRGSSLFSIYNCEVDATSVVWIVMRMPEKTNVKKSIVISNSTRNFRRVSQVHVLRPGNSNNMVLDQNVTGILVPSDTSTFTV